MHIWFSKTKISTSECTYYYIQLFYFICSLWIYPFYCQMLPREICHVGLFVWQVQTSTGLSCRRWSHGSPSYKGKNVLWSLLHVVAEITRSLDKQSTSRYMWSSCQCCSPAHLHLTPHTEVVSLTRLKVSCLKQQSFYINCQPDCLTHKTPTRTAVSVDAGTGTSITRSLCGQSHITESCPLRFNQKVTGSLLAIWKTRLQSLSNMFCCKDWIMNKLRHKSRKSFFPIQWSVLTVLIF